ncbi:MAG: hypothetical protein ORN54_02090 [Cyclobacteriaceae bacterium]|nr:hypothetical protein [Cyclobacteriaceae bacterium]
MRFSLIFLFLLLSVKGVAQTALRQAQGRMDKGRWAEAKELLKKTAKKEGVSVELSFLWAQWFFSKANPNYHADSAYQYCQKAIQQLRQFEGHSKDRVLRPGLDSAQLILYRDKIDSTVFANAKEVNT